MLVRIMLLFCALIQQFVGKVANLKDDLIMKSREIMHFEPNLKTRF